MTENACKNCNAPLDMAEAKNGVIVCSFCGSVFTLPKRDASDKTRKHLEAGETALDQCRFDDAFASYGKAIEADKTEPEAYWGRALARNKVQYLKDTVNNRLQPICHEASDEAFTSDPDYNKALSLATPEQKAEYAKKAEEIDYIRKEFAALKKSGLTYDSFICVKVTEDGGGHTEDSFAALKLYNALKKAGYKPFFSEEEMGERTGADYEALILYALKSAGSLLIVCSDKKYLETKWVRNEYTRFAAMLADEEKERDSMTIVYRGKPIEKLPGVKGKIQGVDFAGFDAIERIKWFIDRHDAGKRAAEEDAAKAAAEREKERAEKERAAAEARAEKENETLRAMQAELKRMQEALSARERAPIPAVPVASAPAPAATYALSDFEIADGVLVQYKGKDSDVVIPAGIGITKIGIKAFRKLADVRSVTIPEGVTEICGGESDGKVWKGAFSGSGLQEVVLPESLTTLGAGAFSDSNLKSVTIPDGVTTMLANVFAGCKNLRQVTLGRGIKKAGDGIFQGCGLLAEVEIPPSLTNLGGVFKKCTGLVRVTIPDSVKEIGGTAFAGCRSLREVTFGRKVTKIGSEAFSGCTSLKEAALPDGVTEIGWHAFDRCTSLVKATFGRKVTKIGSGAFADCTALKEAALPDSVTEIEGAAFKRCTSLATATISAGVIGEAAFSGCTALVKAAFGRKVTKIGEEAFSGCTQLAEVTFADSAAVIGRCAFAGCTALTTVAFGSKVTAIGGEAFGGCPIEAVRLPDSLTYIGDFAFACNAMEEVYIPYAVETIGECAFGKKKGVLRIRCAASGPLPGWKWSWLYNGDNKNATAAKYGLGSKDSYVGFDTKAFPVEWRVSPDGSPLTGTDTRVFTIQGKTLVKYNGSQSKVVTVPDGVEIIGKGACANIGRGSDICREAKHIILPAGVKKIEDEAFFNSSVESIDLPDSLIWIGARAFADNDKLTRITIPKGVKTIPEECFRNCFGLQTVELPEGLEKIGKNAFYGKWGGWNEDEVQMTLSSIRLPDSLKKIEDGAFYCCPIRDILIPEGVTGMGRTAFGAFGRAKVSVKVARKKPLFRLPDGWDTDWRDKKTRVKWNVKRP